MQIAAPDLSAVNDEVHRAIPARAWMTMIALLTLYILSFVDRQIIALMVDPIRQGLDISNVQVALVHGVAFSLFYAAAGIPFGWAVDRGSARWAIFLGVLGWSLSTILCGFTRNFHELFLARLGVGIGEAALVPAAFSVISSIFPRGRLSLAASVFMIGSQIGAGASLAIGGAVVQFVSKAASFDMPIVGTFEPWRAVFIVVGMPGFVLSVLAFLLPSRKVSKGTVPATRIEPVPHGGFWVYLRANWKFFACHLSAFALLGCAAYSGQGWGPSHVAKDFHWQLTSVGAMFALIIGGIAPIGTIVAAAIVDKWYRSGVRDAHERFHLWTTLLTAPVSVGAFLASSPWPFFLMFGITYLVGFSFGGTATAAMQLVAPSAYKGRVASLYGMALALGGAALGPLLVAFVHDHFLSGQQGLGAAIALSVAVCTVAASIFLALSRKQFVAAQDRRQEWDRPAG